MLGDTVKARDAKSFCDGMHEVSVATHYSGAETTEAEDAGSSSGDDFHVGFETEAGCGQQENKMSQPSSGTTLECSDTEESGRKLVRHMPASLMSSHGRDLRLLEMYLDRNWG